MFLGWQLSFLLQFDYAEYVAQSVDNGNTVDVIYLDFANAFDKVPLQRLPSKLEAHGISGKVSHWINSWFKDREQRVVLNGNFSSRRKVVSCVPQSSVLCPTLFLVYINDLGDKLSSNVLKFADNTKLIQQIKSHQDMHTLQCNLDTLLKSTNEWQMCFNVDKCKVVHFGRTSPQYTYLMNQSVLQVTDSEKDLGVEIQNSLRLRLNTLMTK